jgi:hypothetical protein
LQIESYEGEQNPYLHSSGDRVAEMNMEYYLEQMKATVAIALDLAGLVDFQ